MPLRWPLKSDFQCDAFVELKHQIWPINVICSAFFTPHLSPLQGSGEIRILKFSSVNNGSRFLPSIVPSGAFFGDPAFEMITSSELREMKRNWNCPFAALQKYKITEKVLMQKSAPIQGWRKIFEKLWKFLFCIDKWISRLCRKMQYGIWFYSISWRMRISGRL